MIKHCACLAPQGELLSATWNFSQTVLKEQAGEQLRGLTLRVRCHANGMHLFMLFCVPPVFTCMFDSPVFICQCVCICITFVLKFVYDEQHCVSAGWRRTNWPTWQRWPYCKNSQTHIWCKHIYTYTQTVLFCRWLKWNSLLKSSLRRHLRWDGINAS